MFIAISTATADFIVTKGPRVATLPILNLSPAETAFNGFLFVHHGKISLSPRVADRSAILLAPLSAV